MTNNKPTPPRIVKVLQVWRSQMNGWAYDPEGICPTIVIGASGGCEPKIIEYGND